MKIVQVSPYSWDVPGGVQAHIRQLAVNLESRGHEVRVLAPGQPPLSRMGVRIVGRAVPVRGNGSVARICFTPQSATAVGQALAETRPDVIHVHEPLAPSSALFAVLRANAPVVATFHANIPPRYPKEILYWLGSHLVRPVWNRLQVRIAVSEAARQSVCSRMGPASFLVIPNGADVERFAHATPAALPRGRHLLFVGRLEPRKGFRVTIAAFATLAERFPDLQLTVVGDGAERTAVDALAPEVRARVHMVGRVPDEALPSYYRAADVFLAPSRGGESFGIVLVEAMAAGLPIVASDIAGYRDVVRHEREALLVPPGDPGAIAQAVSRLLERPSLGSALAERGTERAKAYSWNVVADRLEEVYATVAPHAALPTRAGSLARR
jgi:phosphatidylinositol alpha-mannosyltransferase